MARRPPSRSPLHAREEFAPIELDPKIARHLRAVQYNGRSPLAGRTNEVVGWKKWPMEKRMAFLRAFVQDTARDPAIVDKAAQILNASGAGSRDHRAQWAALLKFVQPDQASGMRYSNERDERFQSPQYTLTTMNGDCDDLAILLAALGDSHRLPWKFAISGRDKFGKLMIWEEGQRWTSGFDPTHIFVKVGWPPFRPELWEYAEPTLNVPLGWSVLVRDKRAAGRADLAGASTELGIFAGIDARGAETLPALITRHARALPWPTIAGSVVATVAGTLIARAVIRRVERKGRRRRR